MMSLELGLFLIETGRALVIDPSTLNIGCINRFAGNISSQRVCPSRSEGLQSRPGTACRELSLGKPTGATGVKNSSSGRNS